MTIYSHKVKLHRSCVCCAFALFVLLVYCPHLLPAKGVSRSAEQNANAKKFGKQVMEKMPLCTFIRLNKGAVENKEQSRQSVGYRVFQLGSSNEYRFLDGQLIGASRSYTVNRKKLREKIYIEQIGLGYPDRIHATPKEKTTSTFNKRVYLFPKVGLRIQISIAKTAKPAYYRIKVDIDSLKGVEELNKKTKEREVTR